MIGPAPEGVSCPGCDARFNRELAMERGGDWWHLACRPDRKQTAALRAFVLPFLLLIRSGIETSRKVSYYR